MGQRGPQPNNKCIWGHDLTGDNVMIVQRKRNGKVYEERQCRKCAYLRNKEWRGRNAKRDSGGTRSD